MSDARIIMHADMDAFFTSVEEKHNPGLKGKPVIVGADPKDGRGRGVVSACNYESRKHGIHSAMPISIAYRLCPAAVFLPPNFPLYYRTSFRIMRILRKYADKLEQVSVDEAYLDVSRRTGSYREARSLAEEIRGRIKSKEGITCSVGIGPNKLVAKIASDYNKPDGLASVEPQGVKDFLFPMPVRKLHGIGRKTEEALKSLGIETINDLANYDTQTLIKYFGRWGLAMHLLANGIDDSEVEEYREAKSISREITFEEDTSDSVALEETLNEIAESLAAELENLYFRTVTMKIRFSNFETHTKQKTFDKQSQSAAEIRNAVKPFLAHFLASKKKIRLIGVKLSGLEGTGKQKTIDYFLSKA